MEVFFGILFLIIVSYMFGYFVGYNKGFKECTELFKKAEKNMWNSAIDDFSERLKAERKETITTSSAFVRKSFDEVVDEIAEQLKGEKQ